MHFPDMMLCIKAFFCYLRIRVTVIKEYNET